MTSEDGSAQSLTLMGPTKIHSNFGEERPKSFVHFKIGPKRISILKILTTPLLLSDIQKAADLIRTRVPKAENYILFLFHYRQIPPHRFPRIKT